MPKMTCYKCGKEFRYQTDSFTKPRCTYCNTVNTEPKKLKQFAAKEKVWNEFEEDWIIFKIDYYKKLEHEEIQKRLRTKDLHELWNILRFLSRYKYPKNSKWLYDELLLAIQRQENDIERVQQKWTDFGPSNPCGIAW